MLMILVLKEEELGFGFDFAVPELAYSIGVPTVALAWQLQCCFEPASCAPIW